MLFPPKIRFLFVLAFVLAIAKLIVDYRDLMQREQMMIDSEIP